MEGKTYTKPSKTTPNRPRTDHESSSSPEANPTSGLHRSDRSRTPVRPVKPRQLGINNTRRSTPPNLYLDLPNHSTDLCKTLEIVGAPHEESIAKFLSTKTCKMKRNRRNPAMNSSNPRTPKTPKSSPLTHRFGRGNKCKRTTNGSHEFLPIKYPRARSRKHTEKTTKRGLRKSPPRTTGNNTTKP
jgi:hypothetical protein